MYNYVENAMIIVDGLGVLIQEAIRMLDKLVEWGVEILRHGAADLLELRKLSTLRVLLSQLNFGRNVQEKELIARVL